MLPQRGAAGKAATRKREAPLRPPALSQRPSPAGRSPWRSRRAARRYGWKPSAWRGSGRASARTAPASSARSGSWAPGGGGAVRAARGDGGSFRRQSEGTSCAANAPWRPALLPVLGPRLPPAAPSLRAAARSAPLCLLRGRRAATSRLPRWGKVRPRLDGPERSDSDSVRRVLLTGLYVFVGNFSHLCGNCPCTRSQDREKGPGQPLPAPLAAFPYSAAGPPSARLPENLRRFTSELASALGTRSTFVQTRLSASGW